MKLVNSFTKLLSSTSKLKTVHLQGFWSKTCISKKNRASSRLLAKNRVSQVFWEPIKNRVSPRSVLLEAVYLEALLYIYFFDHFIKNPLTTIALTFLTHVISDIGGVHTCVTLAKTSSHHCSYFYLIFLF